MAILIHDPRDTRGEPATGPSESPSVGRWSIRCAIRVTKQEPPSHEDRVATANHNSSSTKGTVFAGLRRVERCTRRAHAAAPETNRGHVLGQRRQPLATGNGQPSSPRLRVASSQLSQRLPAPLLTWRRTFAPMAPMAARRISGARRRDRRPRCLPRQWPRRGRRTPATSRNYPARSMPVVRNRFRYVPGEIPRLRRKVRRMVSGPPKPARRAMAS